MKPLWQKPVRQPGGPQEAPAVRPPSSRRWHEILHQAGVFFLSRWILLGSFILIIFLFTVLDTLQRDGSEIFQQQQGALVLEVFSRTGLKPESYDLLQEKLRALDGVKEVVAVSPDDALKKMSSEAKLPLDAGWLLQANEDLKDKGPIFPWTYDLHLARWDQDFLRGLTAQIEGLEVGYPPEKAVAEAHYDQERWALAYALRNYLRWVSRVLWVGGAIVFSFLATFVARLVRSGRQNFFAWRNFAWIAAIGALAGLACHLLYLAVLSSTFFPETFSWKSHFGRFLPQQVGLSVLFVLLGYGYRTFGKRNP